ncbi:MAG: Mu transposase C-terminal domain-containing protein [Rhodospirillales bacterium]|nr:Mu transposase C-terminal domain-containing protein [Rhodospirillales bacterium]
MKKEWFSAAEIAAEKLGGMPESERGVGLVALREGWGTTERSRRREGRKGGGFEYHYTVLGEPARTELVARYAVPLIGVAEAPAPAPSKRFAALPEHRQKRALERARAVARVEAIQQALGWRKRTEAIMAVCREMKISRTTLYSWIEACYGVALEERAEVLAGMGSGGARWWAPIDEEAWDFIRGDYLRPARPSFESCWRRLKETAAEKRWQVPAPRTVRRKIEAIPLPLRVLAREGADAARRFFPAQERDRRSFHALEAVNADGHRWDVFVRWEDRTVSRPVMVTFQDLYSDCVLAWRINRTESRELVRLAFGDVLEYGIPEHCFLDNGHAFASKWLTGGMPNRYRFKVRPEEPLGLMTALGVQVHWTTPYAGQSKPIERAFGDFARDIARHPAFEGAWCGNDPLAKPENYGSRAIPIETFRRVVGEEIQRHNAREGRRTAVCEGRKSFLQAFEESYRTAPVRKAAAEYRRLCLLAAEQVTARKVDGSIHLMGNRYWHEQLIGQRGKKVTVRFDPMNLLRELVVYRPNGAFLCVAELLEAAGFADVEAARKHAAARNAWMNATRAQLAAERKMSAAEVAAMLPRIEAPEKPEAKVIRPIFAQAVPKAAEIPDFDEKLRRGRRILKEMESGE